MVFMYVRRPKPVRIILLLLLLHDVARFIFIIYFSYTIFKDIHYNEQRKILNPRRFPHTHTHILHLPSPHVPSFILCFFLSFIQLVFDTRCTDDVHIKVFYFIFTRWLQMLADCVLLCINIYTNRKRARSSWHICVFLFDIAASA